jgi:outer membrane protein OmpA-like peptidoglycan-associated protein
MGMHHGDPMPVNVARTGSDDFNQTLSERRAATVRDYIAQQGLAASSITSKRLGSSSPIGDNTTAAGRQQNRRVEIVVSGDVIGVSLGR